MHKQEGEKAYLSPYCWCPSCILLRSEIAEGIPSIWNDMLVEAWFVARGTARDGDLCEWWSPFWLNSASTSSRFEPRHTAPCPMSDSSQRLGGISLNSKIQVSSIASIFLPWHIHWHRSRSQNASGDQVRSKLVWYWSSLLVYQRISISFLPTERFPSHSSMHVMGMKWRRSCQWTFFSILLHLKINEPL